MFQKCFSNQCVRRNKLFSLICGCDEEWISADENYREIFSFSTYVTTKIRRCSRRFFTVFLGDALDSHRQDSTHSETRNIVQLGRRCKIRTLD